MTKKTASEHIDKLFSRQMLGAVFVGGAAGKVVEKVLNLITGETHGLLLLWMMTFVIFVFVFIYWDKLEQGTEETVEEVSQVVGEK